MNLGQLRARLARLCESIPTACARGNDPVTLHLRARIAAGEGSTSTTPEARAEAEALVSAWLARGSVRS